MSAVRGRIDGLKRRGEAAVTLALFLALSAALVLVLLVETVIHRLLFWRRPPPSPGG